MLSKERIHLMTRLADYRQENQNRAMRIRKYYRSDFIAFSLVRNLIVTTIAYFILLGMFALYHMDFFLANMNGLQFGPLGAVLLILYLMMLGIYSVITYVFARVRYLKAIDGLREYDQQLRVLGRLYDEEAINRADPFGGSK